MEKEFMNLTGSTYAVAQDYLRRNGGRVEYALNEFYDRGGSAGGMRQSYSPGLVAIFEKYASNCTTTQWEPSELLHYIEDLELSLEDPTTLCLSQMLCIEDLTKPISREQFLDAWADLCCDTLESMKTYLQTLHERLQTDLEYMKSIYSYTFPLNVEPGSNHMSKEMATEYWNIFFNGNKYALHISPQRLESWLQFLDADPTDPRRQKISRDTWLMFYKFVDRYPDDNSLKQDYDEMAAWPLIIDEYYEYLEERDMV